jgi:peptide deformylase
LDGILYPRRIRDLTQFGFNDALFPGETLVDE